MQCDPTDIPEVLLITPKVFQDSRGFFMETFSQERYAACGIPGPFVQDNYSHSRAGILRGLHYQLRRPQGKLVSVIWGTIFDVAVDMRVGSPTFGRWVGQTLSDQNRAQLYVPPGFAHGFSVLSEKADVMYKCTEYYVPADDRGLLWSDPDIGIDWVLKDPTVSDRDKALRRLRDIPPEDLPQYRA
ncbi:MAG: dTDP-4-dehydrorhamnose 3,5-epimerase [Verrucomicrobia bacterium]|nr:dTDP-4-dehydrorhamnose 3,5-epimerase [Verrucomicrobiota bacterium]